MKSKKYVAASGKHGNVIAARIERGEDVINSIIELIKENGFNSGTVTGIGSLNSATVMWAKSTDLTLPGGEISVSYTMDGPVDLGYGWGMFGTDVDGTVILHFHAIIMDKEGNMRCGNLQAGSAKVMATVDIVIQELVDLEVKPILDPLLNHKFFNPTKKP